MHTLVKKIAMATSLSALTDESASTLDDETPEAEHRQSDAAHLTLIGKPQNEVLKDEVLRKIGRNLLLFQQMEGMLKFLLANGSIDGHGGELQKLQGAKGAAINRKAMGHLAGDCAKVHLGAEDSVKDDATEELQEGGFSFRSNVEADAAFYEQRRTALADLVAQRNELIHQLLPRWDTTSRDSTQELAKYLDRQCKKVCAEFEVLKGMVKSFEEGRRTLVALVASGEGRNRLELQLLRHSTLVVLLGKIAQRFAREDGCVLLNTASDLLWRVHTIAARRR